MLSSNHFIPNSYVKREFSKHALKRSCQRAISQDCIRLVKVLGLREFDGKGGIRCTMTSCVIEKLRLVLGSTQKLEALKGVYVVISTTDETVITVGHLH